MLPVANKPILAFVLEKLISHNFCDFIFVCNHVNRNLIEYYVKNKFVWTKNINFSCQFYSVDHYQDMNESLAHLFHQDILTKDFMILRGDCITECNFNDLVDNHYLNSNTITTVYSENPLSPHIFFMDEKTQ